jgi:hypothetical protein
MTKTKDVLIADIVKATGADGSKVFDTLYDKKPSYLNKLLKVTKYLSAL